MTKRDIVKIVADRTALTQVQSTEVVDTLFHTITEALARDGRLELRSFGIFEVRTRKARRVRNPKNGELMTIPEKLAVSFKPGQAMREYLEEARLVSS